jgi:outer membrane lipoprotein SlyB
MRTGCLVVLAAGVIAGQAHAQGALPSVPNEPCGNCGVIRSISQAQERQEWTPLGAVSPGTTGISGLGGASGSSTQMSFGRGFSNQGMVVIGAAGGAAYEKKPNEYRRTIWEVTVKLDSGPTQVVTLKYEPLLVQEGDRVRVSGNNIELVNP